MKVTRTKNDNLKIKFENTEEKLFLWGLLNNIGKDLLKVAKKGFKDSGQQMPELNGWDATCYPLWTVIDDILVEEGHINEL